MRILLLGEYSNVHNTLAKGLRRRGHEVSVVSNGDFWKDYPRDIDVSRRPGRWGGIRLLCRIGRLLPALRGYDIVQLINPMFFELRAGRLFSIYRYLRKHNRRMVLCAFGMDYYWVDVCSTRMPLRYSDFNIGKHLRRNEEAVKERREWIGTEKERLNRMIANSCDGIVAGLYEYWACYSPFFPSKTVFIPFPIQMPSVQKTIAGESLPGKIRLFIGISKNRSEYKGTDIMLSAARAVQEKYPERVELKVVEGVPFRQYVEMMEGSDVILDQLYSYTPSMNPLEAMARGIICVGGGEPENYEILGERELRPIINVLPTYESCFTKLEQLVLHRERIPALRRQSIEYVARHHDYLKVAEVYESFYKQLL